MARWSLLTGFALGMLFLGVCGAYQVQVEIEVEDSAICDACLEFSSEAQQILSDPETEAEAVELLSSVVCKSLPGTLKAKCFEMVGGYVPDVLHALQSFLGPQICTQLGVCYDTSLLASQLRGNPSVEAVSVHTERDLIAVGDEKTCSVCENLATRVLRYLATDAAKVEIIAVLHKACSKWKSSLETRQCDILVDMYGPKLISRLELLTPEQVCRSTRFCKSALAVELGPSDCAICQFVILEMKIKLEDPSIQERLLEVFLNGCNRVQNHVDECKMIVSEYGPFILANLDTLLNADALCSKIGACQNMIQDFEPHLAMPTERHSEHVHAL